MKPLTKYVLVLWSLALAEASRAQYWAPMDQGIRGIGQVNVLYADTVWDRLLAGGTFGRVDGEDTTLIANGAAQWDGVHWDTLPSSVTYWSDGTYAQPIFDYFRYKGSLYCVGAFNQLVQDSIWNTAFSKWSDDSLRWGPLECINDLQDDLYAMIYLPFQDTVYLTGYRSSICGYPAGNAFKYDGDTITPFDEFDDFPGSLLDYVGYVFRYQNQLYMTGSLHDTITGNFYSFMRYTGNAWEGVPGWNTLDAIKDVLYHDGRIYVCGTFFTHQGAPGNMVAAFDGLQWDSLGGGLMEDLPFGNLGYVADLHFWNDELYAAGQFNYAGGVPARNVARWNGYQWCGLGGLMSNQVPGSGIALTITDWRDSLYMAGGFVTIDGDTLNKVARWLGVTENCSPPIGVQEVSEAPSSLHAWPNPAGDLLHFNNTGPAAVEVFDATGRMVLMQQVSTRATLDVSRLQAGCYTVQLREGETWQKTRFVKR